MPDMGFTSYDQLDYPGPGNRYAAPLTFLTSKTHRFGIFFIIAVLSLIPGRLDAQDSLKVRVGAYNNPPKISVDDKGNVGGFHFDLIQRIAEENNWELEFITGDWADLLEMTETGEIDIMPDVAFSRERSRRFEFNEETVFINWAVLYSSRGFHLGSFSDLKGKKIACMREGIHTIGDTGIISLTESLGIDVEFLLVPDYQSAFQAMEDGQADAAVVNRVFGNSHETDYSVQKTSIVFNPVSIMYAFPMGGEKNPLLIEAIDRSLVNMKADRNSLYHSLIRKYMSGYIESDGFIPVWIWVAFAGGGVMLLGLSFFSIKFRREIRRREKLEVRLRETSVAAESAARAKSIFLANMSHEIRTPMNAIVGYAHLFNDTSLNDRQREYLGKISTSAKHLLEVINNILDFSKIDAGKAIIESKAFDPRRITEQVYDMIAERAQAKGIRLNFDCGDLPAAVKGDASHLRQVLLNIAGPT